MISRNDLRNRSKLQSARTLAALAIAISSSLILAPASEAGDLAVKAGKIVPVVGEPIENGVILIRDGKIDAIGTDLDIPVELPVVEVPDGVVLPGFVDAHSAAAMSQSNENNPVVPFLSVLDSIDPSRSYFESCLRNGFTTASVVPGNSTVIGGQTAIIKTAGTYVNDMVLRNVSGMKISLAPRGGSRMAHMAQLRRELDKAVRAVKEEDGEEDSEDKEEAKDAADKKEGDDKTKAKQAEDIGLEAMKKVVQGELPVFLYCSSAMDVGAAKRLRKQYNLDVIFVLSADCHKAADELSDEDRPVILDSRMVFWETDPRTREDKKVVVPEIFEAAGVEFILSVQNGGGFSPRGSDYPNYQMALCVKYGISENEALEAFTIRPAKALGIDEFVGSIEVGKDADLVVLTGDPLDVSTWVDTTIVAGEVVYERDNDDKIQRLLSTDAE